MAGAKRHPISPEDNWLLRRVADPQISPDGTRVAYVLTRNDRESNERQLVDPGGAARRRGSRRARSRTGRRTTRRAGRRTGATSRSSATAARRARSSSRRWTAARRASSRKAPHGVNEIAWSPDATRIAYVARTGEWKDAKDRNAAEQGGAARHPRPALPARRHRLLRRPPDAHLRRRRRDRRVEADHGRRLVRRRRSPGRRTASRSPSSPTASASATSASSAPTSGSCRRRAAARASSRAAAAPAASRRSRRTAAPIAFVGHEHGDAGSSKNTHLMVVPAAGGAAPRSLSAPLDRTAPVQPGRRRFAWLPGRQGRSSSWRRTAARSRCSAPDSQNGSVSRVLGGERQIEPDLARRATATQIAFTAACLVDAAGGVRDVARATARANATSATPTTSCSRAAELGATKRMTYNAPRRAGDRGVRAVPAGLQAPASATRPTLYIHGGPHAQHPRLGLRDAAAGARRRGLRRAAAEPARQQRLRRGVPGGVRARLGRQGLRRPDGRRRRAGASAASPTRSASTSPATRTAAS